MLCRNKNRERYLIVKLKTKAMKKIICLIAMALFTVTGCTSVEMNQTKTDTPDDNTQGNATTLSCADYTLNPLWNWAETPANQLIVIRSQAELADFIFPNDKLPEDIDFERTRSFWLQDRPQTESKASKKLCKGGCSIYIFRNFSAERHHRSPEMACSAVGSVCSERSENIARSGD